MKITLAEALLRRKELQAKVDQLKDINHDHLFEMVMKRRQINDDIDDIAANVPKLTAAQVTEEYNFYAKRLRLVDAIIQRANWETDVEVGQLVMQDYYQLKADSPDND